MTHIVITALSPFENRGVEALALSIVAGLNRHLPDARISILTEDPEAARPSFPDGSVTLVRDQPWAPKLEGEPLRRLLFPARRYVRQRLLGRLKPSEKVLSEADLVIVSGGDTFSSTYGAMERYLRQLDLPLSKGTPVMFFAHSIGPFDTASEMASFRRTARRCRFTVREEISRDFLLKEVGVSPERVEMTADPAFLMEVPDPMRAALLAEYDLTPGDYAALVFSRGISEFLAASHEDHLAACTATARWLLERLPKIVLVPHVQIPWSDRQNDLMLAKEIHAALDHDPRCVVMDRRLHSAIEFKAVVGRAAFAVAERTHGAIGAMSSGVPTLSIGYSIKAEGVLRQLVTSPDLLSRSLVPLSEFTPARAVDVVEAAWNVRDQFAGELLQTLPEVKARSERNFDILRSLLPEPAPA